MQALLFLNTPKENEAANKISCSEGKKEPVPFN